MVESFENQQAKQAAEYNEKGHGRPDFSSEFNDHSVSKDSTKQDLPGNKAYSELNDKTGHWQLVFDSEFSSPNDLKKWTIQDQSGSNSNNELSAYVTDAFKVHDGKLYIQAEKRDATYGGNMMHYTSGLLNTRNKFDIEYGRFDIRLKVPEGKGFWPAFWLLPSSGAWPPEIDFLEVLGDKPNRMYFTNHWPPDHNGQHPSYGTHWDTTPDYSQKFHVVSGIWSEKEISYYVDGKKVASSTSGIPHEKMYMILNLAVGGDWPGSPDEKTKFPNNLMVDYVRVYKPLPDKGSKKAK